jgi:hypothetical protein
MKNSTIKSILKHEIHSKINSVDRLVRLGLLDAAAREDAVREGISWALFVLNIQTEKKDTNEDCE